MVGVNYELVDYGWLYDRGRRLKFKKTRNRLPHHRQVAISERWQENRAAVRLAGRIIPPNPLPSGVVITWINSRNLEICVCLPEGSTNSKYHLSEWGLLASGVGEFDRTVMADVFRISSANSKLLAVCTLDFLNRLLNLKCWGDSVLLSLSRFHQYKAFYRQIDSRINAGLWDFQSALDAVLGPPTKEMLNDQVSRKGFDCISKNARLATLRHQFTPYDYLWRTQRTSINEAQIWAEWAEQTLEEINNA